jgi:perosamine synthetase
MQVRMFRPSVSEHAIRRVTDVLRSGWLGEGPVVAEFEARMTERLGARAVAVNSGTAALHLALRLSGVGPGDEVVTTAQTMLATSQAILATGARPVYADIQYRTGNLDPESAAQAVTAKTRAILAVDWAGYPCDWDELRAVARRHSLATIDDAAHALGARYRDRPVGAVADRTCFSLQAIKHLTTGDGGLLCSLGDADLRRARALRWFGIDREARRPSPLGEAEFEVAELGYKYHMNDVAAAIGLGNLEELDGWLGRRRALAERYRESLGSVPGLTLFERAADRQSADWLFSIHVERRDAFCAALADRGVEVSIVHSRIDRHPICGGLRPGLASLDHFGATHVCLPLHAELSDAEHAHVVRSVQTGW